MPQHLIHPSEITEFFNSLGALLLEGITPSQIIDYTRLIQTCISRGLSLDEITSALDFALQAQHSTAQNDKGQDKNEDESISPEYIPLILEGCHSMGYSDRVLGELINYSGGRINNIRRGKKIPGNRMIKAILGVRWQTELASKPRTTSPTKGRKSTVLEESPDHPNSISDEQGDLSPDDISKLPPSVRQEYVTQRRIHYQKEQERLKRQALQTSWHEQSSVSEKPPEKLNVEFPYPPDIEFPRPSKPTQVVKVKQTSMTDDLSDLEMVTYYLDKNLSPSVYRSTCEVELSSLKKAAATGTIPKELAQSMRKHAWELDAILRVRDKPKRPLKGNRRKKLR